MPRLIETRKPDGSLTYVAEEPATCAAGHPITQRIPWDACHLCLPRHHQTAQWRCADPDCPPVIDPLHEHGRSGTDTVVVRLDGTVDVVQRR